MPSSSPEKEIIGDDKDVKEPPVLIGLEIHVQLTNIGTKLFCGCDSDYRDSEPNSNTCPVCLGLPGSLPSINPDAIRAAIRLGTALHMFFPDYFVFSRKNYFYPDLPKNFQISQYPREDTPVIAANGYLDVIDAEDKRRVRIRRIQLEEDPGRLIHQGTITKSLYTLIDYNRSGMGLIEIVTEPDITSPSMAQAFLRRLRAIIENQEISNCDLEGAMRVDANISISGHPRVEIKNITGHREVKKALQRELKEQRRLLRHGREIRQVTKHWDATKGQATVLRVKEKEQDYKYFPEPNLP
ncbi:MAG: Asp-tRNA(Asn)/Glu-tRNA(Gln) amidotransferase subunit GatB, partial [Candidatus Ranarchaeia archaeon]